VKCSICGKEVSSAIKPSGSDKLFCENCFKNSKRDKCLVCARFERLDDKGQVIWTCPMKYLTDEQVDIRRQRVEQGRNRCIECRTRKSAADSWVSEDEFFSKRDGE
jgi:hypothetical protein